MREVQRVSRTCGWLLAVPLAIAACGGGAPEPKAEPTMESETAPNTPPCDPDGDVEFICGPVSPEDLVAVPEAPWVIVSSMSDEGQLFGIDSRDQSLTVLFPNETSEPSHDTATYGSCPGYEATQFRPHGISLQRGSNGLHTLYVVRHGARESVEVFEVDARGAVPSLTWKGCVVAPDNVTLNSVAPLPNGAFAVTNFQFEGGELWEWQPAGGWAKVPGSETSGANGLEASPDGRWFYIGGWTTQSLIQVSRGQTPPQVEAVDVGFHIDNVHWAPDGSLLAAGHVGNTQEQILECLSDGNCDGVTSRVAKIDPERLTVEEIVRYPSNDFVIMGTAALEVGAEIWVGGIGGADRIGRFRTP